MRVPVLPSIDSFSTLLPETSGNLTVCIVPGAGWNRPVTFVPFRIAANVAACVVEP
jgi:hypothetical protein